MSKKRCECMTNKNKKCKRNATEGNFCYQHFRMKNMNNEKSSTKVSLFDYYNVPKYVFHEIAYYLDIVDINNLVSTCKKYKIKDDNNFWNEWKIRNTNKSILESFYKHNPESSLMIHDSIKKRNDILYNVTNAYFHFHKNSNRWRVVYVRNNQLCIWDWNCKITTWKMSNTIIDLKVNGSFIFYLKNNSELKVLNGKGTLLRENVKSFDVGKCKKCLLVYISKENEIYVTHIEIDQEVNTSNSIKISDNGIRVRYLDDNMIGYIDSNYNAYMVTLDDNLNILSKTIIDKNVLDLALVNSNLYIIYLNRFMKINTSDIYIKNVESFGTHGDVIKYYIKDNNVYELQSNECIYRYSANRKYGDIKKPSMYRSIIIDNDIYYITS